MRSSNWQRAATRSWSWGWLLALGIIGVALIPDSAVGQDVETATANLLAQWIEYLQKLVPDKPEMLIVPRADRTEEAIRVIDRLGARLGEFGENPSAEQVLRAIRILTKTKKQVDDLLEATLERRFILGGVPTDARDWTSDRDSPSAGPALAAPARTAELTPERRAAIRVYLRISASLIDLSGRLQRQLRDSIQEAAFVLVDQPAARDQMILQLLSERSDIGAVVLAPWLIDPKGEDAAGIRPLGVVSKARLLALISRSGRLECLPHLATMILGEHGSPELRLVAAETVRKLGLPQVLSPDAQTVRPAAKTAPRPPQPVITAATLSQALRKIDGSQLTDEMNSRRLDMLRWLDRWQREGVGTDGMRVGNLIVQSGDWLLMRSPSPYNHCTDIAPGLFTHVGVIARVKGSDGIWRMALVDVTERQAHIGANNVEQDVLPTLQYAVLRHDDPTVAKRMGEIAASLVGNELEFDLGFDLKLVSSMKGQSLSGRKIKTYCAGLLWLCAQETDRPRAEFFPIPEYPTSGKTVENLKTLGMKIGRDFVSPTGPLFAPKMRLVGFSRPIHDHAREIEQRVFDYFATSLAEKNVQPSHSLYQSFRLRLAEMARGNPLLAQAIAASNSVHADTDLVSAARAVAMVETLDEVAYSCSGEFLASVGSLRPGTDEELAQAGVPAPERERIRGFRQRHADLWRGVTEGKLLVWQVNDALVKYYSERGERMIDERFFLPKSETKTDGSEQTSR